MVPAVLIALAAIAAIVVLLRRDTARVREIARLKDELARANTKLDQQSNFASVGQMVSGLAQELKTPLQEVLGNTELMLAHSRSGPDGDGAQTEELEQIQQGAARAAAVVRDLVAFTETVSLSARWHDVNDIVDRAIEASRRDLEAHRIQVERGPLERVPMAYLDGRQLEKVLATLIARPAHAPATTTDAAEPKPVSVTIAVTRVANPEDHVVIVITENGWKADDHQMSLAAARRVVHAHGGSLAITPLADGVGSRATIELPIAAMNKAAAAAIEEKAR